MPIRGRLLTREVERRELIKRLLRHYESHQPFLKDLEGLRRRYARLLRALSSSRRRSTSPHLGADPGELWRLTRRVAQEDLLDGEPRRRSRHVFLRRYMEELEGLAKRWGLDAPWAAPILHETLMRHAGQRAPLGSLWPVQTVIAPVLPISISLKYIPLQESWQEFEERLLREARRQRDELAHALAQQGAVFVDAQPRQEEHLHWLFWLLCPGLLPERTYAAVAEKASQRRQQELGHRHLPGQECPDCYVSPDSVRKAVRTLASKLCLKLPIRGRGRPRKV